MRFSALTLLALVSVATAGQVNDLIAVAEGIINARQDTPSTPGSEPEPSSTPAPSSSPNDDDNNETSAPPPPASSAAPSAAPSNQPSSNPPASSVRPSQAPSSAAPAPSSDAPETTSEPESEIPESTPVIVASTVLLTVTRSSTAADGSVAIVTEVANSVFSSTAGFAANTAAPGLNNNGGDGDDGGISSSTQKIIGGVVGGVGGALLIGGLALVYLRFRKRNKSQVEIDEYPDGINEYKEGGNNRRDSVPLNSTPFQSNLEQYHNPPARPNAAANF